MLYALIAAIAILITACYVVYAEDQRGWHTRILVQMVFTLLGIAALVVLIGMAVLGINYHGAQYKANIINREYGTDYTQEEVFYADSVIDTIRELDRKRVEVNGDVFRERDAERNLPRKDNH